MQNRMYHTSPPNLLLLLCLPKLIWYQLPSLSHSNKKSPLLPQRQISSTKKVSYPLLTFLSPTPPRNFQACTLVQTVFFNLFFELLKDNYYCILIIISSMHRELCGRLCLEHFIGIVSLTFAGLRTWVLQVTRPGQQRG